MCLGLCGECVAFAAGTAGDQNRIAREFHKASTRTIAGAGLLACALPIMSASIFRAREAGTRAFMMRFSRPGIILDRFSRSALRPSDTHWSTLIAFIPLAFVLHHHFST